MRPVRFVEKMAQLATAALVGTLAVTSFSPDARAEGPVSPTGKGIVGGAFLGGEVVSLTMAAVGVNDGWPYLVFAPVGAAGGAVGGWAVEKAVSADDAEIPAYMLAGGMALLIPTIIAALNATAYEPPSHLEEGDKPITSRPASEPPIPRVSSRARHVATSVVDLHRGNVSMALPAVEVGQVYSKTEVAEFGLKQGTAVRIPVLRASF